MLQNRSWGWNDFTKKSFKWNLSNLWYSLGKKGFNVNGKMFSLGKIGIGYYFLSYLNLCNLFHKFIVLNAGDVK